METSKAIRPDLAEMAGLTLTEDGTYTSADDFQPMPPASHDETPTEAPQPTAAPPPSSVQSTTPAPPAPTIPADLTPDEIRKSLSAEYYSAQADHQEAEVRRLRAERVAMQQEVQWRTAAAVTPEDREAKRWLVENAHALGFVTREEVLQREVTARVATEATAARKFLDTKFTEPAKRALAEQRLLPILVDGVMRSGKPIAEVYSLVGERLREGAPIFGYSIQAPAPPPQPSPSLTPAAIPAPVQPMPQPSGPAGQAPPPTLTRDVAAFLGLGDGPFTSELGEPGRGLTKEELAFLGLGDGPFS